MEKEKQPSFPTEKIEELIGYSFKSKALLKQAFTRRSYERENDFSPSNEELEFIGDSVLSFTVVKRLSERSEMVGFLGEERVYRSVYDEAELSELKISLVRRESLARATERLGLQKYLLLGKGDALCGVAEEASVKEDLFEAIVGAVALDSGWRVDVLDELTRRLLDVDSKLESYAPGEENYERELEMWFKGRGEKLEFNISGSVCKNLEYGASVNLGMDMLNYTAYGYGLSEDGARKMAARDAVAFIKKTSDRAGAIIAAVGAPDLDRAINQLQELYQKGLIAEPQYRFRELEKTDTGNPEWEGRCFVEGIYDGSVAYRDRSKSLVKKYVAFDVLCYLIGKDIGGLFEENGFLKEQKIITQEEE